MNHAEFIARDPAVGPSELTILVQAIPPARRGAVLESVVSFRPAPTLKQSLAVGPIRAAFADYREDRFGGPIPAERLRAVLQPPVPIGTVLEFNKLMLMRDAAEIEGAIGQLADHLQARIRKLEGSKQLYLFEVPSEPVGRVQRETLPVGESVPGLQRLVEQERKLPTIYADPPWPYENEASRAAAVNHYPTMPINDICAEPVHWLAEDNAHLHLWTTNAFLREAFSVMDAWGSVSSRASSGSKTRWAWAITGEFPTSSCCWESAGN